MSKYNKLMCNIRKSPSKEMLYRFIIAFVFLVCARVLSEFSGIHLFIWALGAGIIYGIYFGLWSVKTDILVHNEKLEEAFREKDV